jgi:hypothetical protein
MQNCFGEGIFFSARRPKNIGSSFIKKNSIMGSLSDDHSNIEFNSRISELRIKGESQITFVIKS